MGCSFSVHKTCQYGFSLLCLYCHVWWVDRDVIPVKKTKGKKNTPTTTNKKEDTPNQKREVGQATGWSSRIGFIFYWVSCSCVSRRLNWCEYRPGVEASRPPPWAPHPHQIENLSCSSSLKTGPAAGCVATVPGLLSPDHGANPDWSWPAVKEASGVGRVGQGCCCSCDPALDPDLQPPSPFGRDLWVLLGLCLRNHKQSDNWWLDNIMITLRSTLLIAEWAIL